MNIHADKSKENNSKAIANNFPKKQTNDEPSFQLEDSYPKTAEQKKKGDIVNNNLPISQLSVYQEMADNSPRVKQLRAYQSMADKHGVKTVQRKQSREEENLPGQSEPIQKKENHTGLPGNLKSGVEQLSGFSMADIKVHYNSDKPAQLQAHAYTQGEDIYVASGQEKHVPHEAWHVVQQKQGNVHATKQVQGINVNDDAALEKEADTMGEKANTINTQLKKYIPLTSPVISNGTAQLAPAALVGFVTAPSKFTGFGMMFDSWGKLESAIESYAILADENISKRHELLTTITSLSVTWLSEFNQRKLTNSPDPKDAPRKILFDLLDPILTQEELEIKVTGGKLTEIQPVISPNPRLTKKLKGNEEEKDAPEGGVFKEDTPIKDADLATIDIGKKGKVCKILNGWQAAQKTGNIAAFIQDFYKVEAEAEPLAAQNFQAIKTGFAGKERIISANRIEPAPGLKYKEKTSHLDHPVFQHPPVKTDIVQVGLGDCYLLAAMISVVSTAPDHFVNHIRDNKNGTVTVKLYKDVGQPVLVTVEKSIVVQDKFWEKEQTDAFASGALWVKLYEKAYVAAGFYGSTIETLPSAQQSYGMIEGGFGHIAQTHITGVAAQQHGIRTGREDVARSLFEYLKCPEIENDFAYMSFPNAELNPQFNEDLTQVMLLKSTIPKGLTELLGKTFVTTVDLKKMLTTGGVRQKYIDIIMNKVEQHKLISGPLGSGKYSQGELNLFKSITDKFDEGRKMTMGTRKDIFDTPDEVLEKGGSAGESMVKGLVGPHEYAILDYAPKPIVEGKAFSVKLRNPWGYYGRKYKKPSALAPVKNETGDTFEGAERVEDRRAEGAESWFDLADIAAYFTDFSAV